MKYFRMSYEEVVFNRSYLNIMLLNRAIPPFNSTKEEDEIESNKMQNNKPSKKYHKIDKPISANDFFMGMMG